MPGKYNSIVNNSHNLRKNSIVSVGLGDIQGNWIIFEALYTLLPLNFL